MIQPEGHLGSSRCKNTAAFRPPFWEGHLLRRPSFRKLLQAGYIKFPLSYLLVLQTFIRRNNPRTGPGGASRKSRELPGHIWRYSTVILVYRDADLDCLREILPFLIPSSPALTPAHVAECLPREGLPKHALVGGLSTT